MKLLRLAPALFLAGVFAPIPAAAQTVPAVYAPQEGYVDAHGVLIYYVSFGTGSPLVVLHGARPDANYDPAQGNAPTNWELYREMWGSHGEFVIDGNLKSVEYVDRLATIHVPTLVVVGDHDECAPSLSRKMHEKIAGSKLAILPNAGHMNFVDQPELWQKAVGEFLAN